MKYKIIIILFVLTFLIFSVGITYSFFISHSKLNSVDQNIAKFIFNTETLDQIELSLIDLTPGDSEEYLFSVSNNYSGVLSDVSVEYQMTIKTYRLVPFIIELYKLDGEDEELILECDETYSRNEENELVCNTPMQFMGHDSEENDNYKLRIEFSGLYDDVTYSNLVDFINIEIKSWQKISD